MTAPAVTHEITYETNELGRYRAVCSCGDFRSSTSNDKTKAVEAGDSHVRSKDAAAKRAAARKPALISVPGCDSPSPATIYPIKSESGETVYGCRCMVCSRCGHHTGNANQGHLWSWCSATKAVRGPHFCCPDDCELEVGEVA